MKKLNWLLLSALSIGLAGCATRERSAAYDNSTDGRTVISSPASPSYGTAYPTSSYLPATNTTSAATASASNQVLADEMLVTQIRQQLNNYGQLAKIAENLQITARNGVVTLIGNVPSRQDREMLDSIVRNTLGVASVTDSLQISTSATGATGTYQESSRVYSPAQSVPVPASSTKLNTSELRTAGEIFSLHVQGLTPADRNLAQRIIQGLQADTTIPTVVPRVNINVGDGQITLQGNVQSEQQRRIIEDAVRRAAGVSAVNNQLQIFTP